MDTKKPEWWCEGKATESQLYTEYLKRGYDDFMPFSDYLEQRKLVLEIVEEE
jgi:hypothetical protein